MFCRGEKTQRNIVIAVCACVPSTENQAVNVFLLCTSCSGKGINERMRERRKGEKKRRSWKKKNIMLSEERPLCDPACSRRRRAGGVSVCVSIVGDTYFRICKNEEGSERVRLGMGSRGKKKMYTHGKNNIISPGSQPPQLLIHRSRRRAPGGVAAAAKQVVAHSAPALDCGGGSGRPARTLAAKTRLRRVADAYIHRRATRQFLADDRSVRSANVQFVSALVRPPCNRVSIIVCAASAFLCVWFLLLLHVPFVIIIIIFFIIIIFYHHFFIIIFFPLPKSGYVISFLLFVAK